MHGRRSCVHDRGPAREYGRAKEGLSQQTFSSPLSRQRILCRDIVGSPCVATIFFLCSDRVLGSWDFCVAT